MSKQIWLGADPGSSNFAVTVVRYDTETRRTKMLYAGMIENPVKNLTANPVTQKKRKGKTALDKDEPSLTIGVVLFTHEIQWLIKTFGVTHYVGERFQARGKMMGDTIESVSIMIGIIISECMRRKIKFGTTIAGVWKGAVARQRCDLPLLYEYGIMQYQKALREAGLPANKKDAECIVHIIDSALIALWHADRETVWANQQLIHVIIRVLIQRQLGVACL